MCVHARKTAREMKKNRIQDPLEQVASRDLVALSERWGTSGLRRHHQLSKAGKTDDSSEIGLQHARESFGW